MASGPQKHTTHLLLYAHADPAHRRHIAWSDIRTNREGSDRSYLRVTEVGHHESRPSLSPRHRTVLGGHGHTLVLAGKTRPWEEQRVVTNSPFWVIGSDRLTVERMTVFGQHRMRRRNSSLDSVHKLSTPELEETVAATPLRLAPVRYSWPRRDGTGAPMPITPLDKTQTPQSTHRPRPNSREGWQRRVTLCTFLSIPTIF